MVVDLVDVDSDKWRQYGSYAHFPHSLVYRREANSLRNYERMVCERAASVVATTEREAGLVRAICPSARVHAIPNGVDRDYFNPDPGGIAGTVPTVSFTGDMSYFPNEQAVVFFAHQVLPLIRHEIPETRFLIVGRQPTRTVLRLQAIEGVEVTGFVPDVRPYLARSHVSVAPFSIAAGIQNKVLEAMAYCLPVVATSRIAQSLAANVAEMVEFGDTPQELASKVVGLLRNPERCRRVGVEGRRRVGAEYDWARSLDRLIALLEVTGLRKPSIGTRPEDTPRFGGRVNPLVPRVRNGLGGSGPSVPLFQSRAAVTFTVTPPQGRPNALWTSNCKGTRTGSA